MPDHDATGQARAREAAMAVHSVAASVRVVHLPGLEHKEDVSNWLDRNDTNADAFTEMCMSAPLWVPGIEATTTNHDDGESGVRLVDFYAYLPAHNYIFAPTREPWPGSSVDMAVPPVDIGKEKPMRASAWLDINRAAVQMTWVPSEPLEIHNRIINDGGWVERKGVVTLNLYRGPTVKLGNAANAEPWVKHTHKVYPDEAEHIIDWLAHRVQRPQEKVNHAPVLGGAQGIGKDTLLAPIKKAIGPWNFIEASPQHMLGRFNGFLKSVILRINEAHDLGGEVSKFAFYERLKAYTAAPPEVLRVDEKNLREYSVLNCVGVILTTNHKVGGIYLPADDRRHYVCWSPLTVADFKQDENYWKDIWAWYAQGGDSDVAAFLHERDLSKFDAKAPPAKTPSFWEIVDAGAVPEDAELRDALEALGNPAATTLERVKRAGSAEFEIWASDRKNRRVMPHRFEQCGYAPVRSDTADDGLWKIGGKRQVVYARNGLSTREKRKAAKELTDDRSLPIRIVK